MAISTALTRIGIDSDDGCIATGLHREVIQSVGATYTLSPEESGALCLFDRAAGVIYTLPAAVEGMTFEFLATVAVTSNAYRVSCATGDFLLGAVMSGSLTVADSGDVFQANGTTHLGISSAGSTTGGLIGGRFKVVAISATQWAIDGVLVGSGTLADPFVTS